MKMLLRDGKVIKNEGCGELKFDPCTDEIEKKYIISINKISYLLNVYDIKKYSDSNDIYYLYNKKDKVNNSEEIKKVIKNLIDGNDSDILNRKDSDIIYSLSEVRSNTIFWDVLNHIIIVLGKENIKPLLLEIEKKKISLFKFKQKKEKIDFINKHSSELYKKISK